MEIEVLILFHISFPQAFFEAGFHISPSVILDKDIGLIISKVHRHKLSLKYIWKELSHLFFRFI